MAAAQTRTEPAWHAVAELTDRCIKMFERLLTFETESDLLEDSLANFRVWADGVDALTERGESLDSRLENQPNDLRLVVSILTMLCEFLNKFEEILMYGNGRANTDNPERHDVLWSIDTSLKSLNLIGVALRRTVKASRNRMSDKSFNPSDHADFREHLERIILMGSDEKYDETDELDSSKLSDLQNLLIDANLRRRHGFLAARKHSMDLEGLTTTYGKPLFIAEETTEAMIAHAPVIPGDPVVQSIPHPAMLKQDKKKAGSAAPPTSAISATGSTADEPLRNQPVMGNLYEVSQVPTTPTAVDIQFPRPPASTSSRQILECPCCYQMISVTQNLRDHLIQDLCPYTCVAADCPTPSILFPTRNEWEEHVTQDHVPQWTCLLCDTALSFDSMEHTVKHIRTLHTQEIDDFGLSEVISWCAVQKYGITSCPLCPLEGRQDTSELIDHVVNHAYDFAFHSLPWSQNSSKDPNRPVGSHSLPQDQNELYQLLKRVQSSSSLNDDDFKRDVLKHPIPAERLYTEDVDDTTRHEYPALRFMHHSSSGQATRDRDAPSLSRWKNEAGAEQRQSRSQNLSTPYARTYDVTHTEHVTSNDSTSVEDMADCLAREAEQSLFDGKQFWPCGSIDDIITHERVRERLKPGKRRSSMETQEARRVDQEKLNKLADFISKRSKKIFAIMLCSNLSNKEIRQAMTQFQESEFDDDNLPLTGDNTTKPFWSPTGIGYRKPWNALLAGNFCSNQWKFLAPVFDKNQSDLALQNDHILPFTWTSQRGGSGTFGEVHEVTIHPAHGKNIVHNSNVAVRKLQRAYTEDKGMMRELEDAWQQEVQAHKKIIKLGHSNIIRFMVAITRDYDRYLMFEWANGGNLREFWLKNSPRLTRTLVKDIMLQLCGLADALEEIHSNNYRHGDMKPENILRVKTRGHNSSRLDLGTLKICDMGLTKYHVLATQSRDSGTSTKFTTWRYEPPEATEDNTARSRRYDTWSIGCIILEFIVWMIYGTEELVQFNQSIVNQYGKQCHYFEMEGGDGRVLFKVHTAVSAMINKLSQNPQCRAEKTALGELLRIVSTKLLVVELGPRSFKTQHLDANTQLQARADSRTLKMGLDDIIKRGDKDQSFWLKGEIDDDLSSLCTPQAVKSEPDPCDS